MQNCTGFSFKKARKLPRLFKLANYEIRDNRKNLSNRASGSGDSFVSFQNIKIVQQMNRIMFERILKFFIIKCNRFISFLSGKDIICVFKLLKYYH